MRARKTALGGVIFVLLVACGGGDGEASSEATDAPAATSAPAATVPGVTDEDGDGDIIDEATEQFEEMVDTEGGFGTVTIGDETWEFEAFESIPIAACDADFFGGFFAVLTDGEDMMQPLNGMTLTLPGGDFTDPPELSVNIAVGGEADWIADETIYERNADLPEGIGVTSFSIDGGTATGTALFYEEESFLQFNAGLGELVTAEGTFEVTCP